MRVLARLLLLAGGLIAAVPGAVAQGERPGEDPLIALGRAIYRQGVLPSGQPLSGIGAAGVTLRGSQAACVTCHRRSGYGSSEGTIEVRSITGPALFGERAAPLAPARDTVELDSNLPALADASQAARLRTRTVADARTAALTGGRARPTYDDASLRAALVAGLDVTGRPMHPAMPRYELDDRALAGLSAYLRTLSTETSPGVTDRAVHLATVFQPGTDPAQRQAVLDILQAFLKDRNLGQRAEQRREAAGQVKLKRLYREWVLHTWDLTGPSDQWPAQLEALYRSQPVFALVSGLGTESWQPIHDFSERFEVPGVMPQVDLPVLRERDFFTVYLSRGMTLEGEALAQHLHREEPARPVVQVYRAGTAGAVAARALRESWAGDTQSPRLSEHVLNGPPDEAFWASVDAAASGANLVLWLSASDLNAVPELQSRLTRARAIYLSASQQGSPRRGLAAAANGRVRLVYPRELPAVLESRLSVVRRWLGKHGIAWTDERLQMNAYLAATVTGMLMAHSQDTYSREYFIERMEHRLGTGVELSIYPNLSLGPGQRYASKGSYIVEVGGPDDGQLKRISEWLVP